MSAAELHRSVLLEEVVEALSPRSHGVYIDATCGLGGHAEAILEASSPDGRLLAIDRDPEALHRARERMARFGDRVTFVEGDFSDVKRVAEETHHAPADGLVADLGVSSMQLDDAARGFSFQSNAPLDMRMGPGVGESAKDLLSRIDEDELTMILREYGEVDKARLVARAILEARNEGALETTRDLVRAVEKKLGPKRYGKIHPATLVFQAIRIAINRELDELDALLAALPQLLKPGGRAAIISFHSLEDRRVKHAFRPPVEAPVRRGLPVERAEPPLFTVNKKPIVPSDEEQTANPRSRSAKLRVAERRAS